MITIQDQYQQELTERVTGQEGKFYVVNTFVSKRDGSRIIGPLEMDQVLTKGMAYLSLIRRLDSKETSRPFVLYRYNQGSFEPIQELVLLDQNLIE